MPKPQDFTLSYYGMNSGQSSSGIHPVTNLQSVSVCNVCGFSILAGILHTIQNGGMEYVHLACLSHCAGGYV